MLVKKSIVKDVSSLSESWAFWVLDAAANRSQPYLRGELPACQALHEALGLKGMFKIPLRVWPWNVRFAPDILFSAGVDQGGNGSVKYRLSVPVRWGSRYRVYSATSTGHFLPVYTMVCRNLAFRSTLSRYTIVQSLDICCVDRWDKKGHQTTLHEEQKMAHAHLTRRLDRTEEAIIVIFCLVVDAYRRLNPDRHRYGSLERLSDSETLAERGVRLVTERAKQHGKGQQVEIVFASLKREFRLGETLAKMLVGLATRIAAKMIAYTYTFLVNGMLGRPQGRIKDLWA